jgi:hypothetical protein
MMIDLHFQHKVSELMGSKLNVTFFSEVNDKFDFFYINGAIDQDFDYYYKQGYRFGYRYI